MQDNTQRIPDPAPLIETIPDNVLVGRQPIFNSDLEIHAYELLFRGDISKTTADVTDGDYATSQLILNTFLEIGPENIVGDKPAFINLTRNFILDDHIMAIDKNKIVIEILEDVEVDLALVNRVTQLSEQGYVIALDDFIFDCKYEALLHHVDIIKIDIMGMSETTLRDEVAQLKKFDVKLLAEKIETLQEFNLCKELGIDYYQGYFLSKPTIVSGNRIPTNRMSILNLMQLLYDENLNISKIEECIVKDVSLSYRLLKNINSSYYGLKTKVESVNHALVLLGIDNIRQWVTMIALARLNDKPNELVTTSLIRAKMCENLAKSSLKDNYSSYFTVGLFSNLDVLLDSKMQDLLEEMPLASSIKSALLNKDGELGYALRCAIHYELGQWDEIEKYEMETALITYSYLNALKWATETMKDLQLV